MLNLFCLYLLKLEMNKNNFAPLYLETSETVNKSDVEDLINKTYGSSMTERKAVNHIIVLRGPISENELLDLMVDVLEIPTDSAAQKLASKLALSFSQHKLGSYYTLIPHNGYNTYVFGKNKEGMDAINLIMSKDYKDDSNLQKIKQNIFDLHEKSHTRPNEYDTYIIEGDITETSIDNLREMKEEKESYESKMRTVKIVVGVVVGFLIVGAIAYAINKKRKSSAFGRRR
jgi:hypothetical protein